MTKHDHDHGLSHDLQVLAAMAKRRDFLRWLAVAAIAPTLGCQSSDSDTGDAGDAGTAGGTADASTSTADASNADASTSGSDAGASDASASATDASASTDCAKIPEETAGPYPGDGTNGPNVLALSGIVRSDIRSSFAGASGTAEGVQLTIKLTIVSTTNSCAPCAGYAVYLWHCNRDGLYSLYSAGITDQNYLRGVQETSSDGTVTFTSIFPACYSGRWPHIHFEVYPSLSAASASANKIATSQIAMPKAACDVVFASTGYSQSVSNLSQASLATDNVFSDGVSLQTPVISGNVSDGYVLSLVVGVAG